MAEGFQISLWDFEASATGVWGMVCLTMFVLVMGLVFQLLPVFKRWLQLKLK